MATNLPATQQKTHHTKHSLRPVCVFLLVRPALATTHPPSLSTQLACCQVTRRVWTEATTSTKDFNYHLQKLSQDLPVMLPQAAILRLFLKKGQKAAKTRPTVGKKRVLPYELFQMRLWFVHSSYRKSFSLCSLCCKSCPLS
jgi:hypothetical protein